MSVPPAPLSSNWGIEASLDVEWVHALAPGANLVLVEAPSAGTALFTAVDTARQLPAVSVISMSWGFPEFSTETSYDQYFTTPQATLAKPSSPPPAILAQLENIPPIHRTCWPWAALRLSPLNAQGTYPGEIGWNSSGGGASQFESQPSFQTGVVTQSTTTRTIPDVSFDAANGVAVYDSYDKGPVRRGLPRQAPVWALPVGPHWWPRRIKVAPCSMSQP